jgi:hypothetical protein
MRVGVGAAVAAAAAARAAAARAAAARAAAAAPRAAVAAPRAAAVARAARVAGAPQLAPAPRMGRQRGVCARARRGKQAAGCAGAARLATPRPAPAKGRAPRAVPGGRGARFETRMTNPIFAASFASPNPPKQGPRCSSLNAPTAAAAHAQFASANARVWEAAVIGTTQHGLSKDAGMGAFINSQLAATPWRPHTPPLAPQNSHPPLLPLSRRSAATCAGT